MQDLLTATRKGPVSNTCTLWLLKCTSASLTSAGKKHFITSTLVSVQLHHRLELMYLMAIYYLGLHNIFLIYETDDKVFSKYSNES